MIAEQKYSSSRAGTYFQCAGISNRIMLCRTGGLHYAFQAKQQHKMFISILKLSRERESLNRILPNWRVALWYSDKAITQSIFWNILKLYGVPNQTCPADLEGCIMKFGRSNSPKHFLEHYKRAGIFNRKLPSKARSQRFAWSRKQQLYEFPVFF